jgi:hypothetical protein
VARLRDSIAAHLPEIIAQLVINRIDERALMMSKSGAK